METLPKCSSDVSENIPVLQQSLSFHLSEARWRSYFGRIECAEGQRSPCALMLERDTNEEGTFHLGRRNKEMKSKHVSKSHLPLISAFVTAFHPATKCMGLQQRALLNSILFKLLLLAAEWQSRKNVFINANMCVDFKKTLLVWKQQILTDQVSIMLK